MNGNEKRVTSGGTAFNSNNEIVNYIENVDEGEDTAYNISINFRFYDTEC